MVPELPQSSVAERLDERVATLTLNLKGRAEAVRGPRRSTWNRHPPPVGAAFEAQSLECRSSLAGDEPREARRGRAHVERSRKVDQSGCGPSAVAARMSQRCAIDLSPGTRDLAARAVAARGRSRTRIGSSGQPDRVEAGAASARHAGRRAAAAATVRCTVPRPPSGECTIWRSSMLTPPSPRTAVSSASAPGRSGIWTWSTATPARTCGLAARRSRARLALVEGRLDRRLASASTTRRAAARAAST